MRNTAVRRSIDLMLALALTGTLGVGIASANPSDGYRDQQDFATFIAARQLDDCVDIFAWGALTGGVLLKNPLSNGAPRPWSDLTVSMRITDVCSDTLVELTGLAAAPPDFVRLESATAEDIEVAISDATGNLELELVVNLEWTAAGPPVAAHNNDPASDYFREERIAAAMLAGTIVVGDADHDLLAGDIILIEDDVVEASIGFANEIGLCCP